MIVTIPDHRAMKALWGTSSYGIRTATVEIAGSCPKCGGPRGEPRMTRQCEEGEFYYVHAWTNPCGHVDDYDAVLSDARSTGA